MLLARLTFLSGVASLVASVSACSSVREMDVSGIPQVSLDPPSNAKAIGKAFEDGGAVVVLLRKGDAIPLVASIELPMARLESGRNVLRFSRDVWLYLSRESVRISADRRRWALLGDPEGLQEIFGLERGTVQMGFRATEADGAAITLGVEAH